MRANPGPGRFIVLEGLDGSGTTTQTRLLAERLTPYGPVWGTREPTGRPIGRLIRTILAGDLHVDPRVLALLFAADRLDHLHHEEGILPRLRRGEHVVSDRYYLSSLAYQTLDAGFSWVYQINRRALRPNLTVFLDVPVPCCLERIGARQGKHQDLFEREEALERVRLGYLRTIERLQGQERIVRLDGCGLIEEVAEQVWEAVRPLFEA